MASLDNQYNIKIFHIFMWENEARIDLGQKTPSASVIIVNFNGGDWLARCVESILNQSLPDYECFIVDNGSTDGSLEILSKLDDRFKIIKVGKNVGFAAANNIAAKKARADWLATLNPDAFAHETWLETLLATPRMGNPVTMIGSRQNMALEPDILDGLGDFYHVTGLAWRAGFGHSRDRNIIDLHEAFGPCAAAALYHRETFLRLGGFDESFFCYHEDVDLAYRFRLDGGICLQNNRAIVDHASSGIAGRASDFAVYHGTRNRIWTFMKNTPTLIKLYALPAHLLMNLVMLGWAIFRLNRVNPTLRGMRDGFFRRPKTVRNSPKVLPGKIQAAMVWWPMTLVQRDVPCIDTVPEAERRINESTSRRSTPGTGY